MTRGAGSANGGRVTATNTGSGDAGTLQLSSTAGLTVGGAAATELGLTVTPGVAAGAGAGFTIAVNGAGSAGDLGQPGRCDQRRHRPEQRRHQ